MNQEQIWDKIALPWKEFRNQTYPDLREFLNDLDGRILDLCCGSGRNFESITGKIYAVDFSKKMLALAKKRATELKKTCILKKADASKLPFKDNFFDAVIFVAALHCIDSKENRKIALKELYRVLKPKAKAFLTVWSRNQDRVKNKPKEALVPWTVEGRRYERYYYIYDKGELKNLLEKTGFKILKIEESDNIVVIIEKP